MRPSYLHHGDPYTGKTTCLYWDGPSCHYWGNYLIPYHPRLVIVAHMIYSDLKMMVVHQISTCDCCQFDTSHSEKYRFMAWSWSISHLKHNYDSITIVLMATKMPFYAGFLHKSCYYSSKSPTGENTCTAFYGTSPKHWEIDLIWLR